MAFSNDKALCIFPHETWHGVTEPSCLSPWTDNQEPVRYRTIEHAPTQVLPIALPGLKLRWMV